MDFLEGFKGREQEIIALFAATFTASEGAEEGALIRSLVYNLLMSTAEDDLFVFTAKKAEMLVGGIIFSRLTYD